MNSSMSDSAVPEEVMLEEQPLVEFQFNNGSMFGGRLLEHQFEPQYDSTNYEFMVQRGIAPMFEESIGVENLKIAEEQQFNSQCGSTMDENLEVMNLAVGYRFSPYDNELIKDYLVRKILGLKLPVNIIADIELYKYDPDQLPINKYKYCKPNEAYFFTRTERKYSTGASSKRTTNSGYWKATGKDQVIIRNKLIIGFKKTMVFYWGKAPSGKRSSWIMHEYRVNPSLIPAAQYNDSVKAKVENYVVCRIRLKN